MTESELTTSRVWMRLMMDHVYTSIMGMITRIIWKYICDIDRKFVIYVIVIFFKTSRVRI